MHLRRLGQSQKLYLVMVPIVALAGDEIWALTGGQVYICLIRVKLLPILERLRSRIHFKSNRIF
jgi:hypothetical protein